jgi:hypothetical protein
MCWYVLRQVSVLLSVTAAEMVGVSWDCPACDHMTLAHGAHGAWAHGAPHDLGTWGTWGMGTWGPT